MGLISFIKEAGEKLFGKNVKAAEAPAVDPAAKANADREAATAIENHLAVDDMMSVEQSAPAAQFYTVVKGDTLSKISKQFYGDANAYMGIFEANKPMLSHPDKIYPGQNLRIPPR